MPRNRLTSALLILVTVARGLSSRRFGAVLPAWVAAYAGDVLWALLVFWLVGFAGPRWPAGRVAAVALALAVAVEISQLYQRPGSTRCAALPWADWYWATAFCGATCCATARAWP